MSHLWTSFVCPPRLLYAARRSDVLHSARQDSLSRHTKVHDNPAKRRRSSAIAPLTPIAPAGPSIEQAALPAQPSNTEVVVNQPPEYTTTADPGFLLPTNHYQSNLYQAVIPDAPIDPMLMHDPTIMSVIPQQQPPQQAVAIDPMLNDDMSSFQNYALPHPDWHEPKSLPPASISQDPSAWAGAFPQQQPQSAMVGNAYYASDGLSMRNIRDEQ